MFRLIALPNHNKVVVGEQSKQVPFSTAKGIVVLVHGCFPKHFPMGTARMKDKETEEGKQKRVEMERSKIGTKLRSS